MYTFLFKKIKMKLFLYIVVEPVLLKNTSWVRCGSHL
jgi:hypothetical protein